MLDADSLLEDCDVLTTGQDLTTILVKARALLSDVTRWTCWAQARDIRGFQVRIEDPRACCWCIEGAIGRVSNVVGVVPPSILRFLDLLVQELQQDAVNVVSDFNDMVSHDVLLQFLDNAIKRSMEIDG